MKRRILIWGGCALVGLTAGVGAWRAQATAEARLALEVRRAAEVAEQIRRQTVNFDERALPFGVPLHLQLIRSGLDAATANRVVLAAQSVFNLRQLRAGNPVAIGRSLDGALRAVRYRIDLERTLWVRTGAAPDEYRAEIRVVPPASSTASVTGRVNGSLFEGVMDAGEGPELAIELANIFGWDLDFHTDPRAGDTFRVAVEKKTYDGGAVRYARILAAEYVNAGRPYRAVLFHDARGNPAYYAPDGSSLQKAFLRSPLKFSAPVTSRFSRSRFHPILKTHRPHLGIDYGAPYGAPVQAIGDGRVVFAGRNGGSGNMVRLRHSNGYETMYLHLSRILARPGARVAQGEIIGKVGATGLATGPHLDFRITQHGAYRNFAALRLPPAEPVPQRLREEFAAAREQALALLPN